MTTQRIGATYGTFNIGPQPSGGSAPVAPDATTSPAELRVPEMTGGDLRRIGANPVLINAPREPGRPTRTADDGAARSSGVSAIDLGGGHLLRPSQAGERQTVNGETYVAVHGNRGLQWLTARQAESSTRAELNANTRFTVDGGDVLVNGRRVSHVELNDMFGRAFGDAFQQGFIQQGGDPRTANPIPGGNGAFFVADNRYGLSREAAELTANAISQLYPGGAGARVVEVERDGSRTFAQYAIQIPGFASPLMAGDLALMMMRPSDNDDPRTSVGSLNASNLGSLFRYLDTARQRGDRDSGSYVAPLPTGSQAGFFRIDGETQFWGPGSGTSEYFGRGAAGQAAVQGRFPPTNAATWFR